MFGGGGLCTANPRKVEKTPMQNKKANTFKKMNKTKVEITQQRGAASHRRVNNWTPVLKVEPM